MRSYDEICKSLNFDKNAKCPIVIEKIAYAYKGPEVRIFASAVEAKKFSTNVVTENDSESKAAYDAWWKSRSKEESRAIKIWNDELRSEFSELNDTIFNLCYDEAYDRGHAYGYDEITSHMYSVVEFAKMIMKAS